MHSRERIVRLALALGLAAAFAAAPALARPAGSPHSAAGATRVAAAATIDDTLADLPPGDLPPEDLPAADTSFVDPPPADLSDDLQAPKGRHPSGLAGQLASWVAAVDDNGALPFLIVDKLGAEVFAFDADGSFLGSAPVLIGLTPGDGSAPGIGRLKLSQIGPDERTTPAGRFVAQFGPSVGHGTMLWVDYHDAISLHPVMSVNPGERREQRIRSPDPAEHRISYGCINVPATFYKGVVLPALAGGDAIVYVLPDTQPVQAFFPAFAVATGDVDPSVSLTVAASGAAAADGADPAGDVASSIPAPDSPELHAIDAGATLVPAP